MGTTLKEGPAFVFIVIQPCDRAVRSASICVIYGFLRWNAMESVSICVICGL